VGAGVCHVGYGWCVNHPISNAFESVILRRSSMFPPVVTERVAHLWGERHRYGWRFKAVSATVNISEFLLFNLTTSSKVVFFDADVLMHENPDYLFVFNVPGDFVAFREHGRPSVPSWSDAFNTHIMFIKPSSRRFNNLVIRSQTGNYRPYTNTDQDVIENEFATDGGHFDEADMPRSPRHQHGF